MSRVSGRHVFLDAGEFWLTWTLGKGWFSFQIHLHVWSFDKMVTVYACPRDREFYVGVD